jgi:Cu-processing system permease protein
MGEWTGEAVMSVLKIAKYQLQDVLRSHWILFYGLFFLATTDALFRFGGSGERVIMSMMNVVLIVIPLVAVVIGAMYLYSSREYVELLLAQPIRRTALFRGLFLGLTLPLLWAFAIGVALPFVYHGAFLEGEQSSLGLLLLVGMLLTVIFVALSFAIALATEDRIRGLGTALALWMFFSVIYNGLMLLVIQVFPQYPLQQPVIAMAMLNPIDLGRILLLLHLDVSALMGFTGAVFERFFGSGAGRLTTLATLLVWLGVPFLLGQRAFVRKNF